MNIDQIRKNLIFLQPDEEEDLFLKTLSIRHELLDLRLKLMKLQPKETPSQKLMKEAEVKCRNPTILKWLRDNSQSEDFSSLVEMFIFLKEKIEVEEKKDHSNTVDITFIAHGSIEDVMIPACCLLPLPSIMDVVLYAPWNSLSAGEGYAMATGRLKPHHRVFVSKTDRSRKIPAPDKLPNHWNSMKAAGEQKIPNIRVYPLRSDDGVWKRYQSLQEKHGPPGRNRIVIPFIFPKTIGSVPFSVVSLALSLVLYSSRFTATVHLSCCLGDQSRGQKFDPEYLRRQYAYASDNVIMKVSNDAYTES
ncbi:uncharacterized protein LOC115386612 isoform X2 [Salarias fasciatus]|uniref:uncharacterized protein LOC115386612 isoform X2 n=1 Tax=Salarias fasciatus TaxID=181472 RepID=UPI00117654A4|nr:uncharacterized protein LOC115386612 isoform X2 [Salarias fasciatus]